MRAGLQEEDGLWGDFSLWASGTVSFSLARGETRRPLNAALIPVVEW